MQETSKGAEEMATRWMKIRIASGIILSLLCGLGAGWFSGDIQVAMVKHLVQVHPQVLVETPRPETVRNWAWGLWIALLILLPFLIDSRHRFREAVLPIALNLLCAFAYFCLQRWYQDVRVDEILRSQAPHLIQFPFDGFSTNTYPIKWIVLLLVLASWAHSRRPQPFRPPSQRLSEGGDSCARNRPRRSLQSRAKKE
ncbi:MAG: hypothetical protein RL095_1123 [Verrucomicrobiota bacterium]|jgi:ABC-type uncharacterized transport system permease subunit